MPDTCCPDRTVLREFALGRLDGQQWQSVEAHLQDCQECQGRLEQLDGARDDLLEHLKHLLRDPAPGQNESDPLVEAVLAPRPASARGQIIADVGGELKRRLLEGPVWLDRFELRSELGVGSFGYVFRAWDPQQERDVALKVQRAGCFATQEETARFLREARSAARLKHPAIVSLYETGQSRDGVGYLVCEFIDGLTLETRLEGEPLDPSEAADIVLELADALQYAHENGVVHRDVKPSNIIVDRRRHAHLMDFGLAKQEGGDFAITSDGRVLGTPAYMSPEQARGDSHAVDRRSDVYSLGVVFYEMLTGRRPFQGPRHQLLIQVLHEDPPPPHAIRPSIPRPLEVICLKAMSRSPEQRYQSAGALADDLRCYQQGRPTLARPLGPWERAFRWCRRYPLAVSVLAAVLLGSVAGLMYLSSLSEYFVRQTALEGARLETKMLDEVWRFYSEEIQDIDFKTTKVAITEKYKTVHPSLPLPATFAIDLAERISHRSPGMGVRVFSRYPWPARAGGGPQDEFDLAALTRLETGDGPQLDPPAEYAHFVTQDGQRRLLYYTARHMEQSCLGCHNDPQGLSPKKDWKLGDVVGVLKIVRPLDREIESTRDGLRGAFALMATTATLLVAMSVVVTIVTQRRRKAAPV